MSSTLLTLKLALHSNTVINQEWKCTFCSLNFIGSTSLLHFLTFKIKTYNIQALCLHHHGVFTKTKKYVKLQIQCLMAPGSNILF